FGVSTAWARRSAAEGFIASNDSGCQSVPRRAAATSEPVPVGLHRSGFIDSIPLNVHVQVTRPKNNPSTVCQCFCPAYGIVERLFGRKRYRLDGEYNQTPTMRPKSVRITPRPEDQITTARQAASLLRSDVKYSQCGTAPK